MTAVWRRKEILSGLNSFDALPASQYIAGVTSLGG